MSAAPVPVVVADVPSRLLLASDEHFSEIVRELRLISVGGGGDGSSTALRATIDEALTLFAEFRQGSRRQAALAVASGREEVTVRLWLDSDAAARLVRYLELLEEIESWCDQEQLLTLAPSPDVSRFRGWFANQILSQLLT